MLHFLTPSLDLQLREICFINVLDSFFHVSILNTFKSTYTPLDIARQILDFPLYLSEITISR